MGRKAQISIVTLVFGAIIAVLLAYWWDSTHKELIAEGVTIGGVDVGGLESNAAASQVRSNLVTPLERTIKVKSGDRSFELTAKELNVHANVKGMVADALVASQEGGLPSRLWRGLSGGEVDAAIKPELAYDKGEVNHFIAHIAKNVGRDPVDASVSPEGGKLVPVASKPGMKVNESRLRKDVDAALLDPATKKLKAEVVKVKPDVTTKQVAAQYPTYIVVDRSNFTLSLYKNLKLEKQYTVAIGAIGYDTPAGLYHIQSKQVDPVWNVPDSAWAGSLAGTTVPPGPENPLKARWMGIYNGAGIHGTSDIGSLGSAASHGCVRMEVPDVEDLYERVDVGTPIYIS